MTHTRPILYSFRRCPYAMRARLAILTCGVPVELREIVLRDKPAEMLAISPKGTVPVLQLPNGDVIEESFEIMQWAIAQYPDRLRYPAHQTDAWVERNDTEFKPWLDRYKYADRYPDHPQSYYRDQCERWFQVLEDELSLNGGWLLDAHMSAADLALLPFIRQCAHVDKTWFDATPYPHLQSWLETFLASDLFETCMKKYPVWKAGDSCVYLND